MEDRQKYGILLGDDIKIHRAYFEECVYLIGIQVLYRAVKKDKHWTTYAEIESNYERPVLVGCIFDDHPKQKTMKKLGWNSERQEDASLISLPYDLDVQVGSLVIVPSGIDNAQGRLFRVVDMSTTMVYPASITCRIVPEFEDTCAPAQEAHLNDSQSMLMREDDII